MDSGQFRTGEFWCGRWWIVAPCAQSPVSESPVAFNFQTDALKLHPALPMRTGESLEKRLLRMSMVRIFLLPANSRLLSALFALCIVLGISRSHISDIAQKNSM